MRPVKRAVSQSSGALPPSAEVAAKSAPKSKPAVERQAVPKQPKVVDLFESAPARPPNPLTADPARAVALSMRYGGSPTLDRPHERMFLWMANLDESLRVSGDCDRVIDHFMKNRVRDCLFRLEGLLRTYRGAQPELEKHWERTKVFEDQLGALGYAEDALALAKRHEPQLAALEAREGRQPPGSTIRWLEKRVAKSRDELREVIREDWAPNKKGEIPALAKLAHRLEKTDLGSPAKDRAFLGQALGAQFDRIATRDLDMNDLQNGLHELRRQLRWAPIVGMALDGGLTLSDQRDPEPRYAALRQAPVARSPFADLPPTEREPNPLTLSRTLYLRVTELVDEFGALKTRGEDVEAMSHALLKSGAAKKPKQAHALALEMLGTNQAELDQAYARAAELYPEARRLGALCRDDLRANATAA